MELGYSLGLNRPLSALAPLVDDGVLNYSPVDNVATDWTARWGAPRSEALTFVGATGSDPNLILWGGNNTATSSGREAYSLDNVAGTAVGSLADVDVTANFKVTDTAYLYFCLVLRGSGTSGAETGYLFRVANTVLDISSSSSGNVNGVWAGVFPEMAANTEYSMRAQAIGSNLKFKIWDASSSEPEAWNAEVSNFAVQSSGWIGMERFVRSATETYSVRIEDLEEP